MVARAALELMGREYHLGKRLYKGRKDLHERTRGTGRHQYPRVRL
jgi:hypothetical protein